MKFVLIDKVVRIESGSEIEAVKSVSLAEEYLADHFPVCKEKRPQTTCQYPQDHGGRPAPPHPTEPEAKSEHDAEYTRPNKHLGCKVKCTSFGILKCFQHNHLI